MLFGAAACGAPPATTTPNAGPAPASTAASTPPTSPEAGLPPPGKNRTPLGAARPTKLDVTLAPIEGGGGVVALSDAADQRWAWLARLDEEGQAGAVLDLGHAHFVAAFAGAAPGDLDVLTTEGRALCRLSFPAESRSATTPPGVEHGQASALTRRVCSEIPSSLVVRVAGRFASIVAHVPDPDEDASPKAKDAASEIKPKPKPKQKPKARAKKRDERKKSHEDAKRSLFASGRTLAVTATWLDDDLAPAGEPIDTKLAFTEPMAGMGLIGGAARADRIDLAFHEKADPKGRDPQAKIGVAKLDAATLELDDGSKKSFGESKLDIGFIEGHQELRLWSDGESSLVLGTRSLRGKCDVTIAAPFVMQMIPDEAWCGVDPARFFAIGQAKRKGTPVPAASLPDAIDLAALRRAPGQAEWDVGRTVTSRGRIYGLDASGIVTWSRGTSATRAPWPLTAERLRLHWGALEPTGSGIAETDDGLVRIDEDGTVHPVGSGQARFVAGPDRAIEPARERRFAVRIGATWVSSAGEIAPLGKKRGGAPASIADDAAVLVGGDEGGLAIEAVGGVLGIASLDADGVRGRAKYVASPVGAGFDAVRRRSGGALVVGPSTKDPTKVVAFAIRADGALGPVTKLGLRGGDRGVRLVALPRGGAIVLDRDRTNVAWLDDDGR
ncbi:MAG TPA: hypothetical protein VL400_06395, partial [Polyangiaceae bacterium]|nr:hypothetical protein [Polyangiaceae bacterium]